MRLAEIERCLYGACVRYVMVSKTQWKPFWLANQLYPQNDWTGWQNGVNDDVCAQAPLFFYQCHCLGHCEWTSDEQDCVGKSLTCKSWANHLNWESGVNLYIWTALFLFLSFFCLRFCRTWTKQYLITSQTRVKRVSRIHHRVSRIHHQNTTGPSSKFLLQQLWGSWSNTTNRDAIHRRRWLRIQKPVQPYCHH